MPERVSRKRSFQDLRLTLWIYAAMALGLGWGISSTGVKEATSHMVRAKKGEAYA